MFVPPLSRRTRALDAPLLSVLAYEGVTQRFGSRIALDGVTLRIAQGERVALVGPSGSGKTSLFRLAYAAFAPTVGRVLLENVDLARLHGRSLRLARAKVAVIFQAHGLIDRLTAGQNAIAGSFGRRNTVDSIRAILAPTAKERDVVRGALQRVGLADRIDDPVFTLSGGQRQRVAVARAIVQEAHLVLADEPAASLDPELARDVVALLLADAKNRGATLVCTLHQPELTVGFDRVVELEQGRVVGDGPVARFILEAG